MITLKKLKQMLRRKRTRPSRLSRAEQLESRVLLSASSGRGLRQSGGGEGSQSLEFYSIDGTGNNLANPDQGSTDEQLIRLVSVGYEDGISTPVEDLPSAREISNAVVAQTESTENERLLSDYIWIWGQFIDHDIDLSGETDPAEEFNIEVPAGDPLFDPFNTGTATIDLNRSAYDPETGTSVDNPLQQLNTITAYLDGSVIYGSDAERAAALRTFEGGKLATSDGDLLPYNLDGLDNAGGTSDSLFLAGDVRANENAALTSMHTIFVREHNRIADELAARDPSKTDEQIYQEARLIVTAELQAITYNEFLPALLGEGAIAEYSGYDSEVDASIANEFSTAIYRMGHSLLSSDLLRLNADGSTADEGNLALKDAFFNPSILEDNGIDSLLQGAATQTSQELDAQIVDDVRNFLFGPPGAGGFDLASLNIQRGRDHGLASYNQSRIDLGLEPATSFADITSDLDVQSRLASVYDSVDDVDLWVGALAEDHLPGSSVGELMQTVLVDQFSRIRDGDRLWYQNQFSGRELRDLEQTTLSDVIERNSDVTGLQDNVFFTPEKVSGQDELVFVDGNTGRFISGAFDGERLQFQSGARWNPDANYEYHNGDFNGDGMMDIAGRNENGQWWVAVSNGETFTSSYFGRWDAGGEWDDVLVGDFNGDGLDDIAGRHRTGQLWVARSTGTRFTNVYSGRWNTTGWDEVVTGDFNGDGNDDIAGRQANGTWWLGAGSEDRFQTSYVGRWSGAVEWNDSTVGDFDGDGLDEIAGRKENGEVWINQMNGSRFQTRYSGIIEGGATPQLFTADINGDDVDDILTRDRDEIHWMHIDSDGNRVSEQLTRWFGPGQFQMTTGDFDNDGADDIIGLNLVTGEIKMTSMHHNVVNTEVVARFQNLFPVDMMEADNAMV